MARVLSKATLVALGLGCGGSEPSDDLSRCGSTGEFGNTGCAEVTGLVTHADGGTVSGAYMSVQGTADGTPGASDSIQATLEIRPVGAMPVVVQAATIVLPAP